MFALKCSLKISLLKSTNFYLIQKGIAHSFRTNACNYDQSNNQIPSSSSAQSLAEIQSQQLISESNNRFVNKKDPRLKSFRPTGVPADQTTVFLFPGQGVQYVGMCSKLMQIPSVHNLFEKANSILGYDLRKLCLNGPESQLEQTLYCQPATFVASLAAVEQLRIELPGVIESCVSAAGFSLGEITALVFAGALSFEDGLRLVKLRAQYMQNAAETTNSGMMTVIFGTNSKIEFACNAAAEYCLRTGVDSEHAICSVANYLFPHCKVIGGHIDALKFIETNSKDFAIKRCKKLSVSGAFHTKLMNPARRPFKEALQRIYFEIPKIAVHSNFDTLPYTNSMEIQDKLCKQLTYPVRWQQTMEVIYSRKSDEPYPKTFECGPGTSLLTILKAINLKARQEARSFAA